jgi:hypothetical protein
MGAVSAAVAGRNSHAVEHHDEIIPHRLRESSRAPSTSASFSVRCQPVLFTDCLSRNQYAPRSSMLEKGLGEPTLAR